MLKNIYSTTIGQGIGQGTGRLQSTYKKQANLLHIMMYLTFPFSNILFIK